MFHGENKSILLCVHDKFAGKVLKKKLEDPGPSRGDSGSSLRIEIIQG